MLARDNLAYEIDPITDEPIRRYLFENGKDDLQAHVEFDEVIDDDWFNYQKHGWYSYKKDQVGTIYQVYDHHNESYTESRTYDVFGKLISKTGDSGCRFGFQSKYYDEESGLNYFYHRYYDPEVGRFINEDPVGFFGGDHFYLFVNNNPVNNIDPYGLYDIDDWLEEANELLRLGKEREAKWEEELLEMEERHRRQEEMKYCPTWLDCFLNCALAGLGIHDIAHSISGRTIKESVKYLIRTNRLKPGIIPIVKNIARIASGALSKSSNISMGALAAFCGTLCTINPKLF